MLRLQLVTFVEAGLGFVGIQNQPFYTVIHTIGRVSSLFWMKTVASKSTLAFTNGHMGACVPVFPLSL